VKVDVFAVHTVDTGGGAPYANPAGTLLASDVAFATDTGFNWHPLGLSSFGADITGYITVPVNETVQFALNSDDGSVLYFGGIKLVDDGGAHSPTQVAGTLPATLTAGVFYPFEIQFYEDFGGPSGVDLLIKEPGDPGWKVVPTTYFKMPCPTPEPATAGLVLASLAPLGLFLRRRR
jgi:hypothetical protein